MKKTPAESRDGSRGRREAAPSGPRPEARPAESESPDAVVVEGPSSAPPGGLFREWCDALVFAFVVAMFIRVFVVELFKIPSGSMSPTLLGDYVHHEDVNADGLEDVVVLGGDGRVLLFVNRGDHFEPDDAGSRRLETSGAVDSWRKEGAFEAQYDRILVNKLAYWFDGPARGDVVVFKVPPAQWDPLKPIYIKRVVGLPGDEISFDGRLTVEGEPVVSPPFFEHQEYIASVPEGMTFRYGKLIGAEYSDDPRDRRNLRIDRVRIREGDVFVLGDNTRSSLDSRYWGGVPLENLKGKAFLRYWPLSQIKFID